MIEQPVEERRIGAALQRGASPIVEGPAQETPGEAIEERSSGPGVEGPHRSAPVREDRPVRDPAEVQHRERPRYVSKQDIVHRGDEGSAFSASRHVPRSQVRHGAATRSLRDFVPVSELEGDRTRAACAIVVEHRLSMAGDEVERTRSRLRRHLQGRGSEGPPEVPMKQRDGAEVVQTLFEGRPHPLTEPVGEGFGGEGELLEPHETRHPRAFFEARRGHGDVDPIGGSPREHPRDQTGRTAQS